LSRIKKIAFNVVTNKICKAFFAVYKRQVSRNDVKYYGIGYKYKKLWYARCADEMLFGSSSSKSDALIVFEKVKIAIDQKLQLKLLSEKPSVQHHVDGVLFLGYYLFGRYSQKYYSNEKQCELSNRVKFFIPINKLTKKYVEKGFLQKAEKGKKLKYVARRVNHYVFLTNDSCVLSRFNFILKSLADYYSGSECPFALHELYVLLRRSCALTLAHRHKMKSTKSAFLRWGTDLTVNYYCINKKKEIVGKLISFDSLELTPGK